VQARRVNALQLTPVTRGPPASDRTTAPQSGGLDHLNISSGQDDFQRWATIG